MLPTFDARGNLPPGIHEASWATVVARFGGSPERRLLLVQLRAALDALAVSGCRRAWLDGSFVCDVERRLGRPPGDVDVGWDLAEVGLRRLAALAPALHPLRGSREDRRRRFGGDYVAVAAPLAVGVLASFQRDREGRPKGLVLLHLTEDGER
jgi:hypothetical protein